MTHKAYTSVQSGVAPHQHISLNSDLVYGIINNSYYPYILSSLPDGY